jgi:hypothetical protein
MVGEGVGGHNMINMTIIELYCTHGFFPKLEFPGGFLYIILISPEGTAKLRWRGGGGKIIVFRLHQSSIRIQRSSVGCSGAEKGTA